MFCCYLCDSQEWTNTGLCSTCHEIGKIIACYDNDSVLKTLQSVYLREKEKCENKAEKEKKEYNLRSKDVKTLNDRFATSHPN